MAGMFEDKTNVLTGASTRLKQDMAGEGESASLAEPSVPLPVGQPEPVFQAPSAPVRPQQPVQPPPPVPASEPAEAEMAVSPFAAPSAEAVWPFWLSVTAVVCAFPPAAFWLLSLVYVLGAPGPFVTIMEVLPTWAAVLVGGGLPAVSAASAVVSLMRTYPGTRGRFLAWLALVASVAYFLGLGLWFLDEFVSGQ